MLGSLLISLAHAQEDAQELLHESQVDNGTGLGITHHTYFQKMGGGLHADGYPLLSRPSCRYPLHAWPALDASASDISHHHRLSETDDPQLEIIHTIAAPHASVLTLYHLTWI